MTTKEKAPRCANTVGAQIEATYRDTSMAIVSKTDSAVNRGRALSTDELKLMHDALGVVHDALAASQGVFELIATHTTDYVTVYPLAESGKAMNAGASETLLVAIESVRRLLTARRVGVA